MGTNMDLETIGVEEIDNVIDNLNHEVEHALNIQEAKERFERMTSLLEEKKQKLAETILALEKTKETLKGEFEKREQEEKELEEAIKSLKKDKEELEYQIITSEKRISDIQVEKEKIKALTNNMKAALEDMRGKLSQVL